MRAGLFRLVYPAFFGYEIFCGSGAAAVFAFLNEQCGHGQEGEKTEDDAEGGILLCHVSADDGAGSDADGVVGEYLACCHGVFMKISSSALSRRVRLMAQNVSSAIMFDISGSWCWLRFMLEVVRFLRLV